MHESILKIPAVCTILGLLVLTTPFVAQQPRIEAEKNQLPAKNLENVRINTIGLVDLFSQLSFQYGIPIGFEIRADEDESKSYSLEIDKGTLSDLLTKFFSKNTDYAWKSRGGAVRIFPNKTRDTKVTEILNTEVSNFTIEPGTSCSTVERSLFGNSKIRSYLKANSLNYVPFGIDGFYIQTVGTNFRLNASNISVESLLDQIVVNSPTAKFWFIGRNTDQTIDFGIFARFGPQSP